MLLHGLAIAPGGSAGLGRSDGVPVVLLPGEPLACLVAYELVPGPRCAASPGLPRSCRTRASDAASPPRSPRASGRPRSGWSGRMATEVMPLASPDTATLAMTAGALGFVVVPAALEGYPAGAEVEVHLFGDRHGE